MTFGQPWLLTLLLLLPLVAWHHRGRRRRAAVSFSTVRPIRDLPPTWAVRLRWVPPALRAAALAALIVCIARPQKANERTRVITEGIAIQLVVDRSGSMLAEDFTIDRRRANRLEAVKKVVHDFVAGGEGLPGRPDDLVGLICFGTYADSQCPLTLDHEHLLAAVDATEVPVNPQDQATALGDGIALGVERMRDLEDRGDLAASGDQRIKSRIMIALTDGESNAGDIDPITAAKMAEAFGIKVYTIGAGTADATAPVPTVDPLTGRTVVRRVPVSIDEPTLKEIARLTGGRYFRATDSDSLEQVYAQIDELERTEIEQRRFTDVKDLAVEPVAVGVLGGMGSLTLPPLLTVVIALLAAEIVLANTRLRTLP